MKTNPTLGAVGRVAPLFLLAGGLVFLAGCGSETESHVVTAPPPGTAVATTTTTVPVQVVTQPTATTLPNGTVVLTQAPPLAAQPQVIVARPARPSSDYIWIDGYWTWRDDRYEWVNAHWEEPPSSSSEWVPPHWEQRSDGNYTFYEGHWH